MLSHCSSGLQIEIEDKEHEPVVQAALLILAECGVDVVRDAKFPNIKINYDRSKNQFWESVMNEYNLPVWYIKYWDFCVGFNSLKKIKQDRWLLIVR